MGNNLYSNLVNFYNVNDENFKEFMAEIYKEMLTTHRDVQYVKEHLTEEIEKKLEIYLVDGKFNINIEEKVNEFLENNQEIKDVNVKLTTNTNNIKNISSQLDNNTSEINYTSNFLNNTLPLESCGTKFFAHRGMSEICPENTIPAYEMAGKNKFYGVETDIAVTSDGQFILMHDNTIDRTTTGTGNVETLTYDYIKSQTIIGGNNYALYPGTKVPSLAEFLICCKKNNLIPLLELKQNFNLNYIESFINEVKKYGMIDKCYIMSFNSAVLQKVREFNTRVKMIILHSEYREDFLNWAVTLKNCGYGIGSTDVTQEQINNCRSKGVFVAIWTVNDYHKAKRLIDFGVDFIISDKIKEVK